MTEAIAKEDSRNMELPKKGRWGECENTLMDWLIRPKWRFNRGIFINKW